MRIQPVFRPSATGNPPRHPAHPPRRAIKPPDQPDTPAISGGGISFSAELRVALQQQAARLDTPGSDR